MPGETTAASSVSAQMMRAAQEEARRKAAQDARQEAENARQDAQLKLSQQAGARAQEEADSRRRAATAAADVGEWTQNPQYQVPFAKAPEEAKRHFSIDTYGDAAPSARIAWDAALRQQGIPVDQIGPNEDVTINPQGEATRRIVRPLTTGQVTAKDLAEKGIDPTGLDPSEYAAALAAKLAPVKAKLDVQQKAALGSAAQAVPVLATALKSYDELKGSTGPIAGRIEGLKNTMGYGGRDFAKANAELRGNLFNVARALQGAGVLTEKDMTRMEEIAPSLRHNREQFIGQVDAVKGLMRERLEAWRQLNYAALDDSQKSLVDQLIAQTKQPTETTPNTPQATPSPRPSATAPAPTPTPAPAPTPAPTQTKPRFVRQNGVTYELGPDGQYH